MLVKVVSAGGEDGVPRKGFATRLMALEGEDDVEADVLTEAAKRVTLPAAIKAGVIIEEDGNLFLPVE